MAWIAPVAAAAYGALSDKGGHSQEDQLDKLNRSFTDFQTQKFLPRELRTPKRGGLVQPFLQAGIKGIGELIQNPGRLSPNLSGSIAARLAGESEQIGRGTRGQSEQAAGAGARLGLPATFQEAIQRSIEMQGNRDQASARRGALMDSEQLRRQDLAQTFDLYNLILQFINSGKSGQSQAVAGMAGVAGAQQAGNQAGIAGLVQALSSAKFPEYLGTQKGPDPVAVPGK